MIGNARWLKRGYVQPGQQEQFSGFGSSGPHSCWYELHSAVSSSVIYPRTRDLSYIISSVIYVFITVLLIESGVIYCSTPPCILHPLQSMICRHIIRLVFVRFTKSRICIGMPGVCDQSGDWATISRPLLIQYSASLNDLLRMDDLIPLCPCINQLIDKSIG